MYWVAVLPTYITTGLGLFIANAIGFPLLNKYKAWKHDPQRERICRRNWRGYYVPDLMVARVERGLWAAFAMFVLLGLAINWVIMTS